MKALVVDPSRTFQRILASAIESGGIDTVLVSTGGEALKLLKQQSFDLVFIAMHLQDMDGPMFASQLRANTRTRQIPLIMITSNEDKRTLNDAFLMGVTEVFPKHELQKITDFIKQFYISGNGNKMSGHILYIEDSPSISTTTAVLKDSGFTVDHFTTGELGMEAFQKNTYDLVLTDILLEGKMSSYEVVRTIRSFKDERNQTPILALSGFDDVARKVELLRSGANDYVTKPMLHEELIARVNNLVINKKLMDKTVALQRRMQELAMKDQLTGLYNRHFLMETAPSKLSEAMRHKIPCCLLWLMRTNLKPSMTNMVMQQVTLY
ncbi:MAG: response regulator [Nitrosomonas sp.]|nr:response regulator [Nitrosomonas sp.]